MAWDARRYVSGGVQVSRPLCRTETHQQRDVAHAHLRGKRLNAMLAVALHIRQILWEEHVSVEHLATPRKAAGMHTLVMAITVANIVTKHVMKAIAGLHCSRKVSRSAQVNILSHGSGNAPQTGGPARPGWRGRHQS